jgi:hypothetical protein
MIIYLDFGDYTPARCFACGEERDYRDMRIVSRIKHGGERDQVTQTIYFCSAKCRAAHEWRLNDRL